jgi:hypothetical protein
MFENGILRVNGDNLGTELREEVTMPQTTLAPSMSVVERFSKVSAGDFEHELERIWAGIETVRESVVEGVRDEKLTPIEGISILSCTTGQLLGYQAFHGQPQPAELLPYFLGGKRQ